MNEVVSLELPTCLPVQQDTHKSLLTLSILIGFVVRYFSGILRYSKLPGILWKLNVSQRRQSISRIWSSAEHETT